VTPRWEALQREWADDPGVLVDVRVPDASVDDWQRVIQLVTTRWPCSLDADDKYVPLPSDLGSLFTSAATRSRLLRVALTPLITLDAFLPEPDIEFDFDPREVLDQAGLDAIVDFVVIVGRTLQRTVHVVIEGGKSPEMDYMRYEPDTDHIVVPE
jgi:hypothetical protein